MTDARRLLVAMTLAAALVGSTRAARGEEGDAESRFHRAYEAEVVDGKLAESAKVYLALLGDEQTPPRIRAEAKYRFAVTTVLLGRSDEARAHLDELVRDAATPEPVRARAKASLEAVSGVGLGTELDRKLQSLVFDLGRASGDPDPPPVYRDFEILGKQAVPMLRQLLRHQDQLLRVHAFRLLMRLDEPGMMKLWPYDFALAGAQNPRWMDLRRYLERHPEQREALEQAILALEDDKVRVVLAYGSWTPSAVFLRAAWVRGVEVKHLVAPAGRAWTDPDVEKLRWEWMCDPDTAVARDGAPLVLASSALKVKEGDPDAPKYLAGVVRAYATRNPGWSQQQGQGTPLDGVRALAKACPPETSLGHLERLVQAAAGAPVPNQSALPPETPSWPLFSGIASAIAAGLEERSPSGAELTRYAEIVLAWADLAVARGWTGTQDSGLGTRLAFVLRSLPRAAGEEAASRVFSGRNSSVVQPWATCLPRRTADDFAVALAAFRAAAPEVRDAMYAPMGLGQHDWVSDDPGHARAVIDAFPEILRLHMVGGTRNWPPTFMFLRRATLVSPEAARTALLSTVRAFAAFPTSDNRNGTLGQLLSGDGNRDVTGAAWDAVVLPVAEDLLRSLDSDGRHFLVERCLWLLTNRGAAPDRSRLADFVAAHVEHLRNGQSLASLSDILPPERWVARADRNVVGQALGKTTPEQTAAADALLPRIAPTPADATEGVRAFVRLRCSEDVQRAFLDRLLREAPVAVVSEFVQQTANVSVPNVIGNTPLSPDALEDAVVRLATDSEPLPPRTLGLLVAAAVLKQPSERLFPAIRKLLASEDKSDVIAGIAAASSLGRAELLDSLAGKLDSMDAGVREAARKAIDAIVELRGLRDEARKRAAETKTR